MAVEYKGGACQRCGYNRFAEALSFHHLNASTKEFSIAQAYNRSWASLKSELDGCMLVCENCHRELHASLAQLGK